MNDKLQAQQIELAGNGHQLVAPTPMHLIELAVRQNADVDKLAKLMDLQMQWEANEARKAYDAAITAFHANRPNLEKIKKVDFTSKSGNTRVNYNYSPLDYITKELSGELSKHGLSFRWESDQKNGILKVTCILRHVAGHSEKASLESVLLDDQRMTAPQRLCATKTLLERYTLLEITGMATSEMDTDGNSITMGDLSERLEWIENCRNLDELQKLFKQAYADANAAKDQTAMKALIAAKDKKKREFAA